MSIRPNTREGFYTLLTLNMLNTETKNDDDLETQGIEPQNHDDDFDDEDEDDETVKVSKSELAELQRKAEKADKLAKTVKHHKDRRRQETQSTPNVSELVQKELQLMQERQKIKETYPNIDIAKAEATAREKGLTLEQAVFVEFGKDLMASRGTA